MASTPEYTSTPHVGSVVMTQANTNLNGSGVLYTLLLAGPNGSRVQWINFQAASAVSAGALRIFLNGVLFQQISTNGTLTNYQQSYPSPTPLVLSPYDVLQVATNNAETWDAFCLAGDF